MTTDLSVSTTDKPSVFISGSIAIRHLPGRVTGRIEAIFDRDLPVLIGDARGADSAVQRLLAERGGRERDGVLRRWFPAQQCRGLASAQYSGRGA